MDTFERRALEAVLGLSVVYTLYPVVGAAVITGTTVTSGASAYGAVKELIAAAAIANDFWLCAVDHDTAGAAQVFRVEIGTGTAGVYTTSRMEYQLDLTAVTINLGRMMVGPYPAFIAAGTQVVARATGTAAKTINLSITVATGI
jgi:hypothetical protein